MRNPVYEQAMLNQAHMRMRPKRPILRAMLNPLGIAGRRGVRHGEHCWVTQTGATCCSYPGGELPICTPGGGHGGHGSHYPIIISGFPSDNR